MLNVKTVAEVNALVAERFGGLRMPAEQIPLGDALGRVTAQDILAQEFVPNFTRATVDGYAVIASDVFGCTDAIPALLTQAGESRMGEPSSLSLQKGQCAYVPTGAELPANADAMVMLENAEDFGGGTIAVNKPVAPGANLIFRGDDLKPGQPVIPAGAILAAAEIGTLAAMGLSKIPVMRKPLAAIISTISVYVYELPHHHCPFCILKREYHHLGYALYIPLFLGTTLGVGTGIAAASRLHASLERVGGEIARRLALGSMLCFAAFGGVCATLVWRSHLILFEGAPWH